MTNIKDIHESTKAQLLENTWEPVDGVDLCYWTNIYFEREDDNYIFVSVDENGFDEISSVDAPDLTVEELNIILCTCYDVLKKDFIVHLDDNGYYKPNYTNYYNLIKKEFEDSFFFKNDTENGIELWNILDVNDSTFYITLPSKGKCTVDCADSKPEIINIIMDICSKPEFYEKALKNSSYS